MPLEQTIKTTISPSEREESLKRVKSPSDSVTVILPEKAIVSPEQDAISPVKVVTPEKVIVSPEKMSLVKHQIQTRNQTFILETNTQEAFVCNLDSILSHSIANDVDTLKDVSQKDT